MRKKFDLVIWPLFRFCLTITGLVRIIVWVCGIFWRSFFFFAILFAAAPRWDVLISVALGTQANATNTRLCKKGNSRALGRILDEAWCQHQQASISTLINVGYWNWSLSDHIGWSSIGVQTFGGLTAFDIGGACCTWSWPNKETYPAHQPPPIRTPSCGASSKYKPIL